MVKTKTRSRNSSSVETRSIKSDRVAVTPWSTDMMCRAVLRENVETEVRGRIAPHRMRMVGVVLGVVPLDQQPGTLQPVVVRLAGRSPSRPGEMDGIQGRLIVVALQRGHPGRCPVQVGGEEGSQDLLLLGVELRCRYAPWLDCVRNGLLICVTQLSDLSDGITQRLQLCMLYRVGEPLVAVHANKWNDSIAVADVCEVDGNEVGRGLGQQDRAAREFGPQGTQQVPAKVLYAGEWAVHYSSEQRRRGGIGAKEARRRGDKDSVHYEVVQRDVVPTKTPSPQAFVTWLAEDPQVIHSRVAAAFPIEAGLESLGVVEHVLQADDRRDRDVPSRRQTGRDEPHHRPLLRWPLLMDREAAVISRGVEPAAALVVAGVVDRSDSLGDAALLLIKSVQPRAGRLRHVGGHLPACHSVVVDHARISHAGNLTPERASREPLLGRRVRQSSPAGVHPSQQRSQRLE